jgi:hypothetical protein
MIENSDDLLTFFGANFPDAVDLMGEKYLVDSYFSITPAPLVSIKVRRDLLYWTLQLKNTYN